MPDLNLVNVPGSGPLIFGDQGSGTRAAADFLVFSKNNTETASVDSLGLPDLGGNQAVRQIPIQIGDIVADSDAFDWFLFESRGTITITKIEYCVDTDTLDGTSNRQTLLVSDNAAAQIASIDTPTANPSVDIATWTTMGSITNGELTNGQFCYFSPSKISSGIVMSGLTFLITYTTQA